MGFVSWNFCQKNVFLSKTAFFQKTGTPLTFSDSPENWFLDQFDYADFKNQIGFALGDR